MAKITTDLVGGETTATFKTRLNAIVQYWTNTALASGVTYGTQRGIFNGLQGPQITNGEVALSFISKINTMNDIDLAIRAVAFGHGEDGFWMDAAEPNTLFTDAAGTIPVASAGDPVVVWKDKSGLGGQFGQLNVARQPTYQLNTGVPVVRFDGIDDAIVAPATMFSSSDQVTIMAGIYKASDAATGRLIANTGTGSGTGQISLNVPGTGGTTTTGINSSGQAANFAIAAAPAKVVVGGSARISSNFSKFWYNGVNVSTNNGVQNASTTYISGVNLVLGAQSGAGVAPFNGDVYSLIVINRAMSDPEMVLLSQLMRFKTGAY